MYSELFKELLFLVEKFMTLKGQEEDLKISDF